VLEAGIDIDLTTLKLIGARGFVIALVGTFMPIAIAFGIANALGYTGLAAVAAGCTFAPTSLGIAMNVLRQSGIANTPVGQLIVAAAIIDDMVACKCFGFTVPCFNTHAFITNSMYRHSFFSDYSFTASRLFK
jgi:Kef-type K+ transport system membrane component KefB